MEEKLNSFINIKNKQRGLQPIVLTQHHPPAWKPFFHLIKSLDHPTLWYSKKKPIALPYKIQNSSLWISGMRDPYRWLQGDDSASGILISVLSLIVLDSTWRLMISYSSQGEFKEVGVTGEVSGRFHDHPPRKLSLPFVHSHPSHPIEGIFSMHRTSRVH